MPLASYDGAANVIYISSLSKILAPAVRIGYVLGPGNFINSMAGIRKVIDVQGDNVMELAIAELMEEGAIRKHVRTAYNIYRNRRENMEQMLLHYLADKVSFSKLAYWVRLKTQKNTRDLADNLLQKGVSIIPTEPFSVDGRELNALRLGYASLSETELENGLKAISQLI